MVSSGLIKSINPPPQHAQLAGCDRNWYVILKLRRSRGTPSLKHASVNKVTNKIYTLSALVVSVRY